MTAKHTDTSKNRYRKPKRVFEKSGLVVPEMSYYVPLENVVNSDKQDIQTMIDRGRYFSIFAPRQSGKTTLLSETCAKLHEDPTYVAVLLSFQQYSDLNKTEFYAQGYAYGGPHDIQFYHQHRQTEIVIHNSRASIRFSVLPSLSGCLFSRCRAGSCPIADAHQETGNRDIFIKIVPMKTRATPADDVFLPLRIGRMEKTGEICKRNTQLTTVGKLHPHRIGIKSNGVCLRFRDQSIHSSTSQIIPGFLLQQP